MSTLTRLLTRKFTTTVAASPSASASASPIRSLLGERDFAQLVAKFKQSSDSYRFRTKTGVYRAVVSRLAAAKRFASVSDILEHQKQYPNITKEGFATRLITLYGLARMHDNAYQLFEELPELKCDRTVLSFNALLTAHVESRKYRKAAEIFRKHEQFGIVADEYSYTILLQALCRSGAKEALDTVVAVLDEMEGKGLTVGAVTYDVVVNGLYEKGRFEEGEKVWERMRERGVGYRVISYNARLKGLVNEGRFPEAEKLVEELKEKEDTKPDTFTYNVLIKGYCKDGKLKKAKNAYVEMLKSGCIENQWTYEVFVPFLCEKGDLGFALQLTNKCLSSGCFIPYGTVQSVVDGLVKQSRVDEAKKLVELARSKGISPSKVKLPFQE